MTICALYPHHTGTRTKKGTLTRRDFYLSRHLSRLKAADQQGHHGPSLDYAERIAVLKSEHRHFYCMVEKVVFSETADVARGVIERSALDQADKGRLLDALRRGIEFADGQHWHWYFKMYLNL